MRTRRRTLAWCVALALVAAVASAAAMQRAFINVTNAKGMTRTHEATGMMPIGTGLAWFDADNDGALDLYVTSRVGRNYLWMNDGAGNFTNRSVAFGVDDGSHDGAGVAIGDYDNDGDDDIFLANSDSHVLFRNELDSGAAGFTDVTSSAGLTNWTGARGTTASWGDYDNDGYLDLYVAHHLNMAAADNMDFSVDHADRLYHNEGDGTFTDVTSLLRGVADGDGNDDVEGFGFVAGFTDFDNDGDLDIYLMNDCPFGPKGNMLWENNGDGTFTEVGALVGADICQNAMGLAMGDYNRDGLRDYFFSNMGRATLLENIGGMFQDSTVAAGLDETFVPGTGNMRVTWGAVMLDYDLDGWQDIAIAAGTLGNPGADPQPNLLYKNNQDGTFDNVSGIDWPDDPEATRTMVRGDWDGDGDPDLAWSNYGGPFRLLENTQTTGNHWLIVELEGQGAGMSNRNGIGAKLELDSAGGTQFFEIHSGSSLGGGDHVAAYFGMGSDAEGDVTIYWPSGFNMVLPVVAADQYLVVNELTYTEQVQVIIDDLGTSGYNPTIVAGATADLMSARDFFDQDRMGAGRISAGRAISKLNQAVVRGMITQPEADAFIIQINAIILATQL